MKRPRARSVHFGGLLVVFCLLIANAGIGLAQEATPSDTAGTAHPAHIHSGTCEELGDVAFPLGDVAPIGADATPASTPDTMAASPEAGIDGPSDATDVVAESTTEVEATLDDILATEHAINVHESAENIESYVACGDLTGPATEGELLVEVQQLNDSGISGEANLVDNGDGTTTVTVTLTQSGDTAGTPGSADAEDGDAAAAVEVTIQEFAYSPAEITITAGQSVTWTNQDEAPHTATARDRDVLQSGTMNQGESFTQVFDTPGTFEYFCEFHPDMQGIVVVEAP